MLVAAGIADLGLALFHLMFWRLFGWPERLQPSGALNTAVTQTLNAMLTYVFVAYGGALIWLGLHGGAPAALPLAGVLFGLIRLALQLIWFEVTAFASRAFTALIALLTTLHLLAALA